MNTNDNREWKVLTWNVRGINSEWKWNAVKNKLSDSNCDVACLQETKKKKL
jgi:exonuclease III